MMTKILAASDSNLEVSDNAPSNSRPGHLRFLSLVFFLKVGQEKNHPGGRGDTTQHKWHTHLEFGVGEEKKKHKKTQNKTNNQSTHYKHKSAANNSIMW